MTTHVRSLEPSDVAVAVGLHLAVLDMEFLSRLGPSFMRAYYRAWCAAPGALALVALDDDGSVVGVLLGATDPAGHVRAMVRGHGASLGVSLVASALVRPRLAWDLVVTRAWRYTRAVARLAWSRRSGRSTTSAPAEGPRVGEVTHVLVDPRVQGRGVGRALVERAIELSRAAGLDELELVTPPDLAARHFYLATGWRESGSLTSRSGEPFVRFRYPLG